MKRTGIFVLALLLQLLFSASVLADGLIIIHPPFRPIPVPVGHPSYAPMEVEYHHVTCNIDNQIATTEVDESFRNPSDQRLEGTYIFPVPDGAHIDKFSMEIDGKMADAELLDATKARQLYEDIVRKARDPALLEYAGKDLFKVRIFPIEPRSSKRIVLKYTQLLKSDAGLVHYMYPLNTEKFSSAPIKSTWVKLTLKTKEAIKSIYSPSHTVEVKRSGENSATVMFELADAKPDTDFQLYYRTAGNDKNDVTLSLLAYRDPATSVTTDPDGYFLLLASAPWSLPADKQAGKDVVFILDTSGSMAGPKIEQAKKALRYCIHTLNPADRLQIVRFSSEAEPLFTGLVDNNEDNRKQALAFVDKFQAAGGTNIDEALGSAVSAIKKRSQPERPCVVVFMTDGQPTVGVTTEEDLIRSFKKNVGESTVRVFSFGVGNDVNTHLLDRLAQESRAFTTYVLPAEDIEEKVSSFFSRVSAPVLTNVKLVTEGVRLHTLYPRDLPDLFEGDQLVLVGRYVGSGSSTVYLEGQAAGKTHRFTLEGNIPDKASDSAFIPRLWATRRVGYLLDEIRLHGESSELKDEVTKLARQFGIVTPYTAYLILEDESHRKLPVASRTIPVPEATAATALKMNADKDYSMKSGEGSVANAQQNDALKRADQANGYGRGFIGGNGSGGVAVAGGSSPAAPAASPMDLNTRQMAESAGRGNAAGQISAANLVTNAQQNSRFINGRAFYQNGTQWVDSDVAKQKADVKRVQVKYNSDEYYDLLKKYPESNVSLSLGANVQLMLGGTLYEITE